MLIYLQLGAVGLVIIATITDHCCQLIIKCKNAAVEMILNSSSKYQELQTEECYEEMAKIKETIENEMTLGDIGKIAVGPWGLRLVNTALIITQTGFCVAYFIFMGNTIVEMFPIAYKPHNVTPVKKSTFLNPTGPATGSPHVLTAAPMNSSTMIPPLEGTSTAPLFVLIVLIPLPFLVAMAYVRSIRKLGPISGVANVTLLAGFFGLLTFLLKGKSFDFKINKRPHPHVSGYFLIHNFLFGERLDTLFTSSDSTISGFTRPHVIGFVVDLFFSTLESGFIFFTGFPVQFAGCAWTVAVSRKGKIADLNISEYMGPKLHQFLQMCPSCSIADCFIPLSLEAKLEESSFEFTMTTD